MPRARVADLARAGIEHRVRQRRAARTGDAVGVARQQLHHARGRPALERVRAQRAAQLPHRRGRRRAVADDVADRDPEPPARQLDGVVEVPARRRPVGRRQVAHRELEAVRPRERLRQQRVLQRRGQVVLDLVAPRAPERLPAQPRQREQVVAVVGRERDREVEDEPDRAERPAVVEERQQRRRLRLRPDLRKARVGAEDRLGALEPDRRRGARGLGQRELGVERQRREPLPRRRLVAGGVRELERAPGLVQQRHPRGCSRRAPPRPAPRPSRPPRAGSARAPARPSPSAGGAGGRW